MDKDTIDKISSALREGIEELSTCEQDAQTEEIQSRIESTRHILEEALEVIK